MPSVQIFENTFQKGQIFQLLSRYLCSIWMLKQNFEENKRFYKYCQQAESAILPAGVIQA